MSFRMQNDTPQETEPVEEVSEEKQSTTQAGDSECREKTLDEMNEEIERELEEFAEEEKSSEDPLQDEVAKWKDTAVRAIADLENYRKRMAREKADTIRFGNQRLIEELLPVLDSFDMGMMAAEQDSSSMIYIGMQMVQKQMADFLTSQGVESLVCNAGDDFDPNLHDAMSQENSDTVEAGKVLRVMRKGYKMGERLIRPVNVVVSQGIATAEDASAPEA